MANHRQQTETIRSQFAKQAAGYARLTGSVKNILFERLVEVVKPTPQDRVLDVACGPGRAALSFAPLVAEATGIDITPQMLAQARAQQEKQGAANVRWVEGDILPLPFSDGAFTIVFTQASFHHFADPQAVLGEMARVCASGGRIIVVDMSFEPAKGLAFDQIEKLRDPSHLRVVPAQAVRAMGRAQGLEEVEVWAYASPIPAEAVLATSVCDGESLARVRAAYREDAASGEDRFGLGLQEVDGELRAAYPMTMYAWRLP